MLLFVLHLLVFKWIYFLFITVIPFMRLFTKDYNKIVVIFAFGVKLLQEK